jgi:hypothetical protein
MAFYGDFDFAFVKDVTTQRCGRSEMIMFVNVMEE